MPLPLCPTILLAAASIALLSGRWRHVRIQWICWIWFFAAICCAMVVVFLDSFWATDVMAGKSGRAAFENDALASFEQCIVLVFGLFAGIAVFDSVRSEDDLPGTYGFLLFALAGLSLVAGSNDFLAMGLSFELLNLSVMALGRCGTTDLRMNTASRMNTAPEITIARCETAGKMDVRLDGFASIWMWLGIAILANSLATTQFDALRGILAQTYNPGLDQTPLGAPSKLVQLGMGLIAISLFTRMGLVPVHLGFYSRWRDCARGWNGLLMLFSQLAGSIALTRLFGCIFVGLGASFIVLATTFVLATFTLSAVAAVRGFSAGIGSMRCWVMSLTLLQSGWLAVGAMIAAMELESTGVRWGAFKHQSETLAIVVFTQLAGVLAFAGLFLLLARLKRVDREIEFLEDVKGLGRLAPTSSIALLVVLASIVSYPFTAGFWARWTLLLAGYNVHTKSHSTIFVPHEGLRFVMLAGIMATMLGASVVIRMAREMFLEPSLARPKAIGSQGALVAGAFAAAASLLLGFCPEFAFLPLRKIQYPRSAAPAEQERGSGKNSFGSTSEFKTQSVRL